MIGLSPRAASGRNQKASVMSRGSVVGGRRLPFDDRLLAGVGDGPAKPARCADAADARTKPEACLLGPRTTSDLGPIVGDDQHPDLASIPSE
jgi:hypothetical protein